MKYHEIPCDPKELPITAHSTEVGLMYDDFMYCRQTIMAKDEAGRTIGIFWRQYNYETDSFGAIEPRPPVNL